MNQKRILQQVIKTIEKNPTIGEEQRGDLKGIYIYQFTMNETNYLLSYRIKETTIEIITFGPWEKYFGTIKSPGLTKKK